jgi:phage/plasmid-like protein (TIGR03299 family)
MAAELTYDANGQAQLFYAASGGTPWHKEGIALSAEQTRDYDAAMAPFDYPLEKRPYYLPGEPTPDGTPSFAPAADAHYVYRTDTAKVLGSVGSAYEIVSNRDAFACLRPLVEAGTLTLETGGVLRGGADAWLLCKWDLEAFGDEVGEVFRKDGGIQPYATVMANHSGRRGVLVGQTPVRVCCANTMTFAETSGQSRWQSVTHTAGAVGRVAAAAQEMFGDACRRHGAMATQYAALMACPLDGPAFDRLVADVIAPDPRLDPRFEPSAKLAESVVNRALAKRAELKRLWTEGKGHTGALTAWYALQAAAELLDHNTTLFPRRAGAWRTASLLTGEFGRMKARVTDNLTAFALAA